MKKKYEKAKSKLSMDVLLTKLRNSFDKVEDSRAPNSSHTLPDLLMSGFAMFNLKHRSLLNFEQQNEMEKGNLKRVFGIEKLSSDAQLRKVLDGVDAQFLRNSFSERFKELTAAGLLKEYGYKIGSKTYLLASNDGVQHFSSKKNCCDKCLQKKHRDGSITYHHNMLCCALVHPDKREVFLLDAESILNEDGTTKNDCELNAGKRLIEKMGTTYQATIAEHRMLVLEDALFSNEPHIKVLLDKGFDYLINVKPKSHSTLFTQFEGRRQRKQTKIHTMKVNGIHHRFEYTNNILLNGQGNIRSNLIHYMQTDKKGKKTTFTWITNILINQKRLFQLMRAARSRWKIENETFNTLKNLGYYFEHNYGHGNDHLSTTFAFLMLTAFNFDQIVQFACRTFQQIEQHLVTKIKFWESIRSIFHTQICKSINDIYLTISKLFNIQLE